MLLFPLSPALGERAAVRAETLASSGEARAELVRGAHDQERYYRGTRRERARLTPRARALHPIASHALAPRAGASTSPTIFAVPDMHP